MTSTTVDSNEASQGHITGFGTKPYRTYVLISMLMVYTLNFIDRNIMAVLGQPIIQTFDLSDTQWGLLAGPPFAIFYAVMGVPIALLADRYNRVQIISVCIIFWSLMTAFCGLAPSFLFLLVCRIGVAVGEAGCTPPANSLISSYYTPRARVGALGVYSMGVTVGATLAFLFGGTLASLQGEDFGNFVRTIGFSGLLRDVDWSTVEGWRIAFVVVGLPGILLAILIWATVKEPPRGFTDPPGTPRVEKAGFAETLRELASKPSFWWMALGASLVAFVGYGQISFQTPFLMRYHDLTISQAAIVFGAPWAVAAAVGTFMGGNVAEQFSGKYPGAPGWVTAIFLFAAVPMYILALLDIPLWGVWFFWLMGSIFHYVYLSAQYTIGSGVVSPAKRATAISILLVLVSLIGNGIGPLFVGILSDFYMGIQLAGSANPELVPSVCRNPLGLSEADTAICSTVYAGGLRYSLMTLVLILIPAGYAYWKASQTLGRDYHHAQVSA